MGIWNVNQLMGALSVRQSVVCLSKKRKRKENKEKYSLHLKLQICKLLKPFVLLISFAHKRVEWGQSPAGKSEIIEGPTCLHMRALSRLFE